MRYFCFSEETKFRHLACGWSVTRDYLHIWRTLHEVELFLVMEGDLYIEQNGERFHLKKGEFLLTQPDIAYGGYAPSDASFHWLHFVYPDEEAHFAQEADTPFHIPQYGKLTGTDSLLVINILLEQYGMKMGKSAVTNALLTALLRDLCSLTLARSPRSKDKRFQPILDYFHNNPYYNEFKDVRAMADYFGYSEKYLIYLFKRNTGQSPLKYLTAKKLQRAQEMLACSDMTVKGIASALHYDYYYFMRLFRRATGMTPTQYRKTVIPAWQDYLPKTEQEEE